MSVCVAYIYMYIYIHLHLKNDIMQLDNLLTLGLDMYKGFYRDVYIYIYIYTPRSNTSYYCFRTLAYLHRT